jgi:amino acid adenylation domain-containing protein
MIPSEILYLVSQRGIRLWVENHSLRYKAPKGALTPELHKLLTEHRDNIIAYLDGESGRASDTYPLSYNQQFLWFLYHLAPQSSAYNVAFIARVVSPVDFPRVETAFQKLVDRHPMLRTTYGLSGGVPSMRIHSRMNLACEHIDVTGWSEEALNQEVHQRYCKPFDLAKGPILRVQLFTCAPEDHVLLLTIHHIACDGWSIGILLKEFRDLYSIDPAINLPLAEVPYTDFIRYQKEMLKGPEGQRLWSFWKQQLAGELLELNLPVDKQRPRTRVSAGGTHHFSITGDFYQSIVSFARSSGATLYTFLLTSFQTLLMRYSSQEDILIGTPMGGRPRKEDAFTVGCYINPIVLRGTISADSTFKELLRRTRKTFADAFENRNYPFPLLVEQLSPARDPSRSPIFQVMFNFLNWQTLGEVANLLYRDKSGAITGESVDFGDLKMRPFPMDQEEGQFDLALEIIDNNHSFTGLLKYCTDVYEEPTITRMASHFEILLQGIVSNPDQRLWELPLLTADERHQLIVEWNDTKVDYPANACIHELFEAQANRTPEAVAVEFEGRHLTYSELDARSSQFAETLQALGIGPDVLVALYVERSLEMVIALLGILKAGGAYLPLDKMFPRERLAFMLEEAKPRVLVTLTRLLGEIPPHQATVVCVDAFSAAPAAQTAVDRSTSRNLAYVLYTSGSTGNPKGVEITHRAVVNFLSSMRKAPGMNAYDTLLSVTTISFDILGLEIWLPLTTGAKVVLVPQEVVMDGKQLARAIAECNATVMQATPATWRLLLESGWEGNPCLKILCGGEAWSQELARSLLSKCASLWNMYGPTETTIWSAVCQVRDGESVSIGRPIANTQFYVVDSHLQPLPVGVPGELLIGGDGLARGYLNRPELTAEKFIPDPFSHNAGSRLYRTGDMVRYLPDGKLEFIARLDQQVKIRGFRIELGEIESILCAKAGVKQAVVMVHEDEGEKRLVAYIVPLGESKQPTADLRDYLKQKLPDYMVPAAFVILPELPLTPNGKVNRKALPIPERTRQTERVYVAPRGEAERRIAQIWQDLLRIEAVGLDDNFFDLGGYSLLLVRMVARLQDAFHKDISVMDLFQHPTVREQAKLLGGEEGEDTLLQDAQTRAMRQRFPFGQPAASRRAGDSVLPASSEVPEGIAVIGMACRFPGANSVDLFWKNLQQGVESIRHFTDIELAAMGVPPEIYNAPNYVKAASLLDDVDMFDAAFFGYSPREAEITDPQHRLFLECARSALEHAGYDPGSYRGAIGVFGGAGSNYYAGSSLATLEDNNVVETYQRELGNEKDYLATRVAYKLNLKGPSLTIQTACSTSLVAAHVACQNLWTYQCDIALAGGVSINARMKGGYFCQEGMILSPDGHCRAFDLRAQGTVQGQGVGIVVLKRLSDALADGDTIHAVIRGSAINNDGASRVGFTAPGVDGQTEVITAAQFVAGVSPEDISYVEAHGTGTPLGDPIEIKALTKAFRLATDKRGFCAIGSVKTNVGHLDAAAGVAGLIKTVLMLEHRQIPPSLHFENPNPHLDLDSSPFFVNTQLREWHSGGAPRRAGVSSFGLGGTNAHMVVEEAPLLEAPGPSRTKHLLLFSAKTEGALDAATANMAAHLERSPDLNLADVAFTLQVGRRAFERRRTVVCCDVNDAIATLRSADPKRIVSTICEMGHRDIAFMFSGQGSQYANMGLDLYKDEPVFREQIDHCSEILQREISVDLCKLLYPAQDQTDEADERLKQTSVTQPALFAIEFALAKLWMTWGIRPQALVGHSIGEFTAACLAEVFSTEDALKLVAARGRLMQEMLPGCMLAVFLPEEQVAPFMNDDLSLSVINSPSLCVVSGEGGVIDHLESLLSKKQVVCRRLHTSHAFHSRMMDPVLAPFAERVKQVGPKPPKIPFLSNVTGTWITREEATDPNYWARHLRCTVRFADCIQELFKEPSRVLLEVGPGRTLSILASQHPAKKKSHVVLCSTRLPKEEQSDGAFILDTLGTLWRAGVPIDWMGFHAGTKRRRVPLPTYAFERQRYWIGPVEQRRGFFASQAGLGKIEDDFQRLNKAELVSDYLAPRDPELKSDYVAPRKEVEQTIAEIWQKLLGVRQIGIHDNFFSLGGSSLIAARLFAQIEKIFGKKLPPASLYEAQTVEQLSDLLSDTPSFCIHAGDAAIPYTIIPGNLLENKQDIIGLWKRNFESIPEERYPWIYEENPFGPATCLLAKDTKQDSIVGATALFPRRVVINGKYHMAGLGGDFAVNKEHRLLAPALLLQNATISKCNEGKFDFLYGFPNKESEAVSLMLGFEVFDVLRMTKPLRSYSYLEKHFDSPAVARMISRPIDLAMKIVSKETRYKRRDGFTSEILSSFDRRFDKLWEKVSTRFPIIGERSSSYLHWRYVRSPHHDHHVFALRGEGNGDIHGYIVFHIVENRTDIDDILCLDMNETLDSLLSEFLLFQRKEGMDSVSISYAGTQFLVRKLQEFGFSIRDKEGNISIYVPLDSPLLPHLLEKENWYFMPGDNDI